MGVKRVRAFQAGRWPGHYDNAQKHVCNTSPCRYLIDQLTRSSYNFHVLSLTCREICDLKYHVMVGAQLTTIVINAIHYVGWKQAITCTTAPNRPNPFPLGELSFTYIVQLAGYQSN